MVWDAFGTTRPALQLSASNNDIRISSAVQTEERFIRPGRVQCPSALNGYRALNRAGEVKASNFNFKCIRKKGTGIGSAL